MSFDSRLIIHPITDDQIRNSSQPKNLLENDNQTFLEDQIKSSCISEKETNEKSSLSSLFVTKKLSNGTESQTPSKTNSADAETFYSETEDQHEEDIEDQHYRRRKHEIKEEKEDFPLDADIEWDVIFENMNKAKLEESKKDEGNKKTSNEKIYKKTLPYTQPRNLIRQPKSPSTVSSTSTSCLLNMMNYPAPPQYHQYPNFNTFPYHYIPAPPSSPFYYGFSNHQVPSIPSPMESVKARNPKNILKSQINEKIENESRNQVESVNKKRKCPEISEEKTQGESSSKKVCVSNIPRDLNRMGFLTQVFKKFGDIVDLKICIKENKAQVLYNKKEEAVKALEIVSKLKDSLFNSQDIVVSCSTTDFIQPTEGKKPKSKETALVKMVQEKLTDKLRDLIATQKDQPGFLVKMKLLKLLLKKVKDESCELEQYKDQLKSFGINLE